MPPLPWLDILDIEKDEIQGVEMKKVGRPRTDTEGVMVKLPREMIDQLDNLRREQKDIPTRPEMIRRIMQEWFERSEKSSSD